MKIVTLDEFLKLPKGTLFQKYSPDITEGLCIKDRIIPDTIDFCYVDLQLCWGTDISNTKNWDKVNTEYSITRDGCFDKDQLFLVYENKDVQELITILQENCLHETI